MADENSRLIETLMGMLGDNPQEKINAVLGSLTGEAAAPAQENPTPPPDETENAAAIDLSMLTKMQGLLSQLGGTNDERATLLLAIKPFLSEERKPHVDRALQLMKLERLARTARELDILKDFKL